ncbi:MAG: hypothetical protein K2P93_04715 [Alphaproteobacteria bacterium]|nr:hypothetical protein [Alphaproteobacteria bacterium]
MNILKITTIGFSLTLMISTYQAAEAISINQTLPHQNDTPLIHVRGGGGHAGFGGGIGGSGIGGGARVEPHESETLGKGAGEVTSRTAESNITRPELNPNKWSNGRNWEGWGAWSLGAGDEGGCTVDPNGNIDCGDTTE